MKNRAIQLGKELGLLLGAALAICALCALGALVYHLTGGSFAGSLWRIGAFAGAIILLLGAVFFISRRLGSRQMKFWSARFPHVPFAWGLVLIGFVLLLFSCAVNYFTL